MTDRARRRNEKASPRPLAHLVVPAGAAPEPQSVGVALPRGRLVGPAQLVDADGATVAAGLTPLHRWPDGSVAWLLVEWVATPAGGPLRLLVADAPPHPTAVSPAPLLPAGAVISVSHGGRTTTPTFTEFERRATPVSTTAFGRARVGPLALELRTTTWPGAGLVRLDVVVHNPRPARHRGGLWDLGDPGSVLIEDVSLSVPCATPGRAEDAGPRLRPTPADPAFPAVPGVPLFQASSGGERWNCANHVDASGRVPLAFRGWRAGSASGMRAQPVLEAGPVRLAAAEFWQQFPKALGLTSDGAHLRLGLFPREHGAPHELQGGERKRHTVWMTTAGACLDFVASPRRAVQPPDEIVATGGVPGLALPTNDPPDAAALAALVVDTERGFVARRELIDEYGWRHFGDLYADHEAVRASGPDPFISHYNNQYDGVEACLLWFLRTGDRRWFDIADPLARHVMDIDLYHTVGDRPAYSGGQFWHTDHYRPAQTATHRCYSRLNADGGPYGGGPGNEQNYPSGLWLYHLLTGDPWSRAAGLQLAEWVHAMDDGTRTPFAVVDPGPTGLASQTYEPTYHGPGRGAGNSLNALVDAWRYTDDRRHLHFAEALVERCVQPTQDLDALALLDAERRWSYVVFLKYLTKYLINKAERGDFDVPWFRARETLLHYARFMVAHEGPSTTHPERLEFVTETWPAQDLRKAQVVHSAAAFAEPSEGARFHAWADALFATAMAELRGYPTADRCRPLVLLLHPTIAQAHAHAGPHATTGAALDAMPPPSAPTALGDPPGPTPPFLPQKQRVRQQVRSASGLAAAARRLLGPAGLRPLIAFARSRLLE